MPSTPSTTIRAIEGPDRPARRAAAMLGAGAAWVAGAFIASHHPLHPGFALLAFAAWSAAALRRDVALLVVPAALPVASAAPWTGWIVVDEFDLLLLGAVAASYARVAWPPRESDEIARAPMPGLPLALLGAFLVATLVGVLRALAAHDAPAGGWFAGYADGLNALRVGKSAVYAVLLLPALREAALRSTDALFRRTALGMVSGTAAVTVGAVFERWAYPGLFDLSTPYRTVAWFWEMHVGGAAIDGYLAIAAPFVAWAVMRASTLRRFAAAAGLALVFEYVCLTTFSRGVYLAIVASLAWLGLVLARRGDLRGWDRARRAAAAALATALVLQAALVVSGDSYLLRRVGSSASDFGARVDHWRNGLLLLQQPLDVALGIGLGRLPRAYAASAPDGRWPGAANVVFAQSGAELVLHGPRGATRAGSYALAQRVPRSTEYDRAVVVLRVEHPLRIAASVCATHLLYDLRCRRGEALVAPADTWQQLTIALEGPPLATAHAPARATVFSLHLPDADSRAVIRSVALLGDAAGDALRNGDFAADLARWFPLARDDFVPWHIDSLPLELLLERGLLGLASFALLVAWALRAALAARNRGLTDAPFLAASLLGALLVGLVSSVLDAPRIAFMLFYLVVVCVASSRDAEPTNKDRLEL